MGRESVCDPWISSSLLGKAGFLSSLSFWEQEEASFRSRTTHIYLSTHIDLFYFIISHFSIVFIPNHFALLIYSYLSSGEAVNTVVYERTNKVLLSFFPKSTILVSRKECVKVSSSHIYGNKSTFIHITKIFFNFNLCLEVQSRVKDILLKRMPLSLSYTFMKRMWR